MIEALRVLRLRASSEWPATPLYPEASVDVLSYSLPFRIIQIVMPPSTSEETPLLKTHLPASCPTHNTPCPVHDPPAILIQLSDPPTKSISETTPLLQAGSSTAPSSSDRTLRACPVHDPNSPRSPPCRALRGWRSVVYLALLSVSVVTTLFVGLLGPSAAARYAKEAAILDISKLAVESFTDRGARVLIQAKVTIDANRVDSRAFRTFGIIGGWLARKVSTGEATIFIYLPDFSEGVLGTATAPATDLGIQNGQITSIGFVSEVETCSPEILQNVANAYFNRGLGFIRVRGEANITLKSGILGFGTQKRTIEMTFEGSKRYIRTSC